MRVAGMVLGALALLSSVSTRARADELPWCTELDPFTRYCVYASQHDCLAAAKDVKAFCVHNPRYQPPPAPAKVGHRQH